MVSLEGKIVKGVGGKYKVFSQGKTYDCFAQKKVKYFYDDVMVGDNVSFARQGKAYVITGILPRANNLLRPAVSNVDEVFVVVAPKPEPDLSLVDKVIVNSNKQAVPVVMILNKLDIFDEEFAKNIVEQYKTEVKSIISVSSLTGDGMQNLSDMIANKTVCLCGQSAVGKTSILNALVPTLDLPTGELSEKTERGRHTTRHNQIYALQNGGYVVDTAGFSLFDLTDDVKKEELGLYFEEIFQLSKQCRFNMCTHTAEPDCAVKKMAENSSVFKQKYQRYLFLFNQLKERDEKKFD